MARDNPTNPFTQDPNHTSKDVQMPIAKARVVSAKGHPDQYGFHSVRIRIYGDESTFISPVLTPMIGSVWVPKEGTDVAVLFTQNDKPWVIGAWYALDRSEDGEIDIPGYVPGDIRLGNDTGSHITAEDSGRIHIETGGLQPIDIDHQSASVRMSSDQTIAGDDSYYRVNFDTVEDDPEDLFVPSENAITIRHGGQHRIDATVEIGSAGQNNRYTAAIFEGGQLIKRKNQQSAVNEELSITVATTRKFDDDTDIDIRMRQNSGSDKIINSSNVATEFAIERHGI